MRKFLVSCIILFSLAAVTQLNGQKLIRNQSVTGVSYAGNKVNRIYIPPPKEFYEKEGRKGGAVIAVTYINCPDNVRAAIDYAVTILERMLPAAVRSSIIVNWQKITTSGVLANSSTSYYIAGWSIDAFKPYVYYPAALAEKIAGVPLNRSLDSDLVLNINNSVGWYYGTDGKTPLLKYDLVTVALHEICHGLGFMDSFRVEGTNGLYGSYNIPLIYDTFIENQSGTLLTDTVSFINPSANLRTALTNGQVYFNGPLLKVYTSGQRARLYAPSTFDSGSSIAHLDPTATSQVNSLMTPYIDMGEAIHDPGNYTMSMLGDIGWINTSIIHEVPKDTEEHVSGIKITATIKSDTTYNHNRVGVVYSSDNFVHKDTMYMTSSGINNTYSVAIPVSSYNFALKYHIFAQDKFLRIFRYPSYVSKFSNQVYIGTDTVKPEIVHTPQKFCFEKVSSIDFDALVADNLGLDTVFIEYRINNGAAMYKGMVYTGKFTYKGTLNPSALALKGGDVIQYRIVAVDKSAAANTKTSPAGGYHSLKIEPVNNIANEYTTDFSTSSADFVNDGFVVQKAVGFSKYGLNTPHPYVSPEETGDSIGYTAVLRTPVKYDQSGMIISYKEVVLVEPGEDGYPFGTTDFYDYVIVEGSKDFGKTWFRLANGYDSRINQSWTDDYNNSITGNNSSYAGEESMLQNHTIFPVTSSGISIGDTMMVRFRLFSDPYSNGWGWIIQDLHIGPLIDRVEEFRYSSLNVYPNPGNGFVTIRMADGTSLKPMRFSIFNSAGMALMSGITKGGSDIQLDITSFSPGVYFIVFNTGTGLSSVKYVLLR